MSKKPPESKASAAAPAAPANKTVKKPTGVASPPEEQGAEDESPADAKRSTGRAAVTKTKSSKASK